ncbi:BTAD domain-containing putative transcriptional regulator [Lentzea sp. NPDC005914]|uniref:AfsR/SARP family transcriptional regulator n=1 Tax=Lentzea sp. NPDC005914 TaxID=3154572 RepID=UPI0033C7DD2D
MAVRFRLLGDVGAQVDDRALSIGYAQLRSVLAILLVEANQVVSVDQLVDRVWGERRLPRKPRAAVQHSMTMLRNALAPAPGVEITRRSTGYQLAVDPETVDLHQFRRLVQDGRAADDDSLTAAALEEALTLWEGEPFAGLTTAWLDSLRATLIGHRHAVRLELVDVQLRLGLHAALLPDLATWAADNPLDERLAGQLMLALYQSGRSADALDQYRLMRTRLAEELGTDPSPPLRRLHEQILVADPALTAPSARTRPVVPQQLPARPHQFIGRTRELADLDIALGRQDGAVVISAVGGLGGMGKTWLTSQWAYRHLDRFPDGQLYVNLRGFDPSGQPMPATTALRGFLDALGVTPSAVPVDVDVQAGLYRSLLAGKRMLVFLDNAADSAQVIPLLPGSPTCLVLVTSRRHLSGLVAAHGARAVNLDRLPDEEARRLLVTHLGEDRLEPQVTNELLACCAGLPLAIGIVAARAGAHPDFPLSALADELRVQSTLDTLDAGEDLVSLRAVFSWSYHALSAEAAEVFRALGLAPGADIGLSAVASLTALPGVRACLKELEQAHLVDQHAPGRYRMHDLVRLYAGELGHDAEAVRRVIDFYVHTAFAAERTLDPLREPIAIGTPATGCVPLVFPDEAAATGWLTTELPNLLAVQKLAAEHGLHASVWHVAWNLNTFVRRRGNYHDSLVVWRAAVAAAGHTSDVGAQALALRSLGDACMGLGLHSEAQQYLHDSLEVSERTGDLFGQAHAHHLLAATWDDLHDPRRALEHASPSLQLFRDLDMVVWEAWGHLQVGSYHAQLEGYEQAGLHLDAALTMARRHGDRELEVTTRHNLGYVAHNTGRHAEALDHYHQALDLLRDIGYDHHEPDTLERLGHTHRALGHHDQARASWQRTLELCLSQRRADDAARVQRLLDDQSTSSASESCNRPETPSLR